MKSLLLVLIFASTPISLSWSKGSTMERKAPKPRRSQVFDLELSNKFNTNIDRLHNPINKKVNTQNLKVKTKYKFRPAKRFILLDLPQAEVEYASAMDNSLRKLNVSNTLLGIYLPKGSLIYNGALTTAYNDSLSTNDEQEIETRQYISQSADGGFDYNFSKKWTYSLNAGVKIEEFLAPSRPDDESEDDYLRFSNKHGLKYKFNKKHQFKISTTVERKIYKEKRALTATGLQTALDAETVQNYKIDLNHSWSPKWGKISPSIGYTVNDDLTLGGRSYRGLYLKSAINLKFKNSNLSQRLSYKQRNYSTQLVNTESLPGQSPILKVNIINISHSLETPSFISDEARFIFGHDWLATQSNRINDENQNHIFKIGLKVKI